jgi:hypothetical protein
MRIPGLGSFALSSCAAAAFLAGCGGGNSSVPAVSADAAAFTHHETFEYMGSAQTFTVPKGVKRIRVDALGGDGGTGNSNYEEDTGGDGGRVVATLEVYPQEALWIYLGGNGSGSTGGFNGGAAGGTGEISGSAIDGGGGGGASDVRTSSGPLSTRILVAGGGGGGGGDEQLRDDGSNAGGDGGGLVGARGLGPSKCRERGRNGYRLAIAGLAAPVARNARAALAVCPGLIIATTAIAALPVHKVWAAPAETAVTVRSGPEVAGAAARRTSRPARPA